MGTRLSLGFLWGVGLCKISVLFLSDKILTRLRILANVLVCHKINKDKAQGKYDKYIGCGDDRDPAFKLVL